MQQNNQQQQNNRQENFNNYQVKEGSVPQTQIKNKKFIKYGALAMLIGFIGFSYFTSQTVNTSAEAIAALQQGYSTQLPVGTLLSAADTQMQSLDFIITHTSDTDKQSIFVWDFAAEDGDYVQLFDETGAITDIFMIKNAPKTIEVAATGVITVKGMIDGGGGITYAVYSPLSDTIYYNGTKPNTQNTYTFIKQ